MLRLVRKWYEQLELRKMASQDVVSGPIPNKRSHG